VLWAHALLLPASLLALVTLLGFAILYHGAIDPALLVRGTIVYSLIAIMLTAVFVTLEGLLSQFLGDRIGLPRGAGAWLGAFAAALAFGPVRTLVERRVRAVARSD
jgi:hypothetical protein